MQAKNTATRSKMRSLR